MDGRKLDALQAFALGDRKKVLSTHFATWSGQAHFMTGKLFLRIVSCYRLFPANQPYN